MSSDSIIDMCVEVVRIHLAELGIKLDCEIEFFPSKSVRDFLPSSVYGVYRGSDDTAYIRVSNIPKMIETLAHEAAHSFLLKNSILGRRLIDKDIIIKIYRDGSTSTEIRKEYAALHIVSKFVNEGFATFVGFYTLKRFADIVSGGLLSKLLTENTIDESNIALILEILEDRLSTDKALEPEYYYGRLEFDIIARVFGLKNVGLAAINAMNVIYEVDMDLVLRYYNHIYGVIYRSANLGNPDLDKLDKVYYLPIPHFRLLVYSRILPRYLDSGVFNVEREDFNKFIEELKKRNLINFKN